MAPRHIFAVLFVSKALLVSGPAPAQGHKTHRYTLKQFIT